MWQRQYDSVMDTPLPVARPWTPPEMEQDASPRSDYFSDPFRPSSSYAQDEENSWPVDLSDLAKIPARCDTPTDGLDQSRPQPSNRVTEPAPYTPVKTLNYGHANDNGALRYPYTPDSSQIVRRHTDLASSPLPWDDFSEHSTSPVQDALSSCIAHFENLIHSQRPDEDQMEYIVAQFEAMTSYLSAPDSQTRKTDDHLFNEPEQSGPGLGISGAEDDSATKLDHMSKEAHEAYVAEVSSYIEGVKKYVQDLKMRLDEVKTLNSIQLDVINDLRRQMRSVCQGMRTSLSMSDDIAQVEADLDELGGPEETEQGSSKAPAKEKEFGLDSWETLVPEAEEQSFSTTLPVKPDTAPTPTPKAAHVRFAPGTRVIHIVRKPERRSFWRSFGEALDNFAALLNDDEITDTDSDDE